MEEELETPTTTTTTAATATSSQESYFFCDDIDSSCSTPYVSAPSSPGRGNTSQLTGFYYSAPTSPVHFVLCPSSLSSQPETSAAASTPPSSCTPSSFEFDFSTTRLTTATHGSSPAGSMSSADELFLNGQIRPMKLSSHLERPQKLAPLLGLDEEDETGNEVHQQGSLVRGRDMKLRDRSLRRRTRSMSPLRTDSPFEWHEENEGQEERSSEQNDNQSRHDEILRDQNKRVLNHNNTESIMPCGSNSSSRSSSVGRGSRKWVFLKEFLYRSKSEGRNNGHKFWGALSFASPVKDKKLEKGVNPGGPNHNPKEKNVTIMKKDEVIKQQSSTSTKEGGGKKKAVNGVAGKRRVPPSAHELHYTTNRAQAEEMRKKTFLPYRQGLLGCLGFSSKSYGAMNGFTRALNPVSSR